jgi:hypothetical protein
MEPSVMQLVTLSTKPPLEVVKHPCKSSECTNILAAKWKGPLLESDPTHALPTPTTGGI